MDINQIQERLAKQLGMYHDGFHVCVTDDETVYKHFDRFRHWYKLWNALLAAETRLEAERWRSVEDGLPEVGARCLLILEFERHVAFGKFDDDYWEGEDDDYFPDEVKLWKPITPPTDLVADKEGQ